MSLQHLEFEIIHATGWDDNYPPEQLVPKDKISDGNNTVKHGKGWQSPRYVCGLCALATKTVKRESHGLLLAMLPCC